MQPPIRLHPRDDNQSYRVLPQERFDAAWDVLYCELAGTASIPIAPSCGATSRAVNLIANAPITQEELAAPTCRGRALTGRKSVYVRQLLFPGDASGDVLDVGAATAIATIAEMWIYVVDLRGPRVISEIQVTPEGWSYRPNPTRVPNDDGFTSIAPGFAVFAADGGDVDDYGFLLSAIRLEGEGFDFLVAAPSGATSGGANHAREATVRARFGSRDRGYVAIPEPLRWAADAHSDFYVSALDVFDAHLAEPNRAATRFVGRTLKTWNDNGDRLGVANELSGDGQRLRATLARFDREDRALRRPIEEAAEYLRQCVMQPDFVVAERSGMSNGIQGLSSMYQAWAVLTHRLGESTRGGRMAIDLCRDEHRLVRRYLLSDADPPGEATTIRCYVGGISACLLLSHLMFAISALGRDQVARVVALFPGLVVPDVPIAEALDIDPRSLPPEARALRVAQIRPTLPSLGNMFGHNMPQKQKSSFLMLNGLRAIAWEQPDADDEVVNQWVRAGRDFVLWNLQDKLGDLLPSVKTGVKIWNFGVGMGRLKDAIHGDHNVRRAMASFTSNAASVLKMGLKVLAQRSVAAADADAGMCARLWRFVTRKVPGFAEGFGSTTLARRRSFRIATMYLGRASRQMTTLGVRPVVVPARLTFGRRTLAPLGLEPDGSPTANVAVRSFGTRGGRIVGAAGGLLGAINSACEAFLFGDDMVTAWHRDDMALSWANSVGMVGAIGCSLLELVSAAVALGCSSPALIALAEMAWPVAIFGALVGLGYLLVAATESNIYERFARFSQFGIDASPFTSHGFQDESWSPVALPAPGRPQVELRALYSLLAQFKITRESEQEFDRFRHKTTIHFSHVSEDAVIRIHVDRAQALTVPLTTSRGRHVPLYPDTRRVTRDHVLPGNAADYPELELVYDAGQLVRVHVYDGVREPSDPNGEEWWTTDVTIRVQLSQGSGVEGFTVPRDANAWVQLHAGDLVGATAMRLETLSHDGGHWVDAHGAPRGFVRRALPAPSPASNGRAEDAHR